MGKRRVVYLMKRKDYCAIPAIIHNEIKFKCNNTDLKLMFC